MQPSRDLFSMHMEIAITVHEISISNLVRFLKILQVLYTKKAKTKSQRFLGLNVKS